MSPIPEEYFAKYCTAPLTSDELAYLETQREQLIAAHAFDGEPSFGTGGMRAVTGPGSNRLNLANIGRLNLAVATYFKKTNASPLIALAYDSRLTSGEFSRLSYHILKGAGLRVRIFRRPTPTPMLSFAVRELGADCGVVLTASHNPPQYNGYKAYGADGGQIISPVDKDIQKLFEATPYTALPKDLHQLAATPIAEADLMEEEIYQAYMARLKAEVFYADKPKHARILYSPLHGTGGWLFDRAFHELGYKDFQVLPEQAEPDGNFPTVKSPNPEEPAAFERLLAGAAKDRPDLLVATDPDADRVGAMLKIPNGYHFLTGNQIGSLLLESIARKKTKSLAKPFMCKTIVTTELQRLIADGYGIKTVETLTGFKYIAEQVAKDPENYLFGGEESFGYLPVHWVRDKDSLSSAVALAELAEDVNLVEALDEIYIRHGLFHELLHSIDLSKNPALLPETLAKLADPAAFAAKLDFGRAVVDILDLRKGAKEPATKACQDLKQQLGTADVIQFWLKDLSRLTIRPSGTEPKIKAYLSLMGTSKPTAASLVEEKLKLKTEAEGILQNFLAALGV
jgi:phosphomannomutase